MDFITDRLYPLLSEFTHASLEVIKNQDQSISYWIVHRNDIYCVGDERKLLFCRLVAATKNREEYIDINVSNDVSLVSNKLSALEFLSLPDSDLRIMIINKFQTIILGAVTYTPNAIKRIVACILTLHILQFVIIAN